ncbi:hypothetical protein TB1_003568 [Malus domestica]
MEEGEILDALDRRISLDMLDTLNEAFTGGEVKAAMFQMHPSKSPNPDGMPPLFFQKYWGIIGQDITDAILSVLSLGKLLRKVNFTHVALIPKDGSPKEMVHFRPISLCNILYKIVSKVLTNRLKLIMPNMISHHQSAFVPGRLILDNVILTNEISNFMAKRRRGKKGFIVLKLDMSKAYDRIEWSYLATVLRKLGFLRNWIELLMSHPGPGPHHILGSTPL